MKIRLDHLLHESGLAPSGEKARQLIKAGQVAVDGKVCDKPGLKVAEDIRVEIIGDSFRYVSRGGLKLEKSLAQFKIDLDDRICLDVGASTGGFTDCMLQNGAAKVLAVDVGTGQLDKRLMQDVRVENLEQVNARDITYELIGQLVDFITMDLSFISLSKVLPALSGVSKSTTRLVALIKPQFEAGRSRIGKKGVVRLKSVHIEVINEVMESFKENGWSMVDLTYSPVTGPKGNIEFLALCERLEVGNDAVNNRYIVNIVNTAHEYFKKGAYHEV